MINRKVLPEQIRTGTVRLAALAWAVLLFGVLAVITIVDRVGELIGG
jgi:hypothetical protein